MLSKLAPPKLERVAPRERLFARLDDASSSPVVWISGPPGAGKTVLVASWLARRRRRAVWLRLDPDDADPGNFFHFLSLSARTRVTRAALPGFHPSRRVAADAFAREYFRALGTIRGRWVLVLDDYHALAAGAGLHRLLAMGLAELPPTVTTLIASRTAPPPVMSALRARGALEEVSGRELLLTVNEAHALLRARGVRGVRAAAARLNRTVGGWVAGLVLAAATDGPLPDGEGPARRASFDFLDEELLRGADLQTRDVLLGSALLGSVSGELARELSGVERAAEVLESFARRGFFTERHPSVPPLYRFHDLFRSYLLDRVGRDWPLERVDQARLRAAAVFERAGRTEDAAALLVEAGAWRELGRVMHLAAPGLAAQGRTAQLADWTGRAPAPERTQQPWLGYWHAVARFPFAPREASGELERVFDRFVEVGDAEGAWSAWAQGATMHGWGMPRATALDDWIELLETLPARVGPCPSPDVDAQVVAAALCAFVQRKPGDPRRAQWERRALELALGEAPLAARLEAGRQLVLWTGWWAADLRIAAALVETLGATATRRGADPVSALFWLIAEADLHAHRCEAERSLATVERGLVLAAESGIRLWTPVLLSVAVWGELAADRIDRAQRWLDRLAGEVRDGELSNQCAFHFAAAFVALRRREWVLALENGRAALRCAEAIGIPLAESACRLTCAIARERMGEGAGGIREALDHARATDNRYAQLGGLFALGRSALAVGDEDGAARSAGEAFALAGRTGCLHVPWFGPEDFSDLCALAVERRIEPGPVRAFIQARRVRPDAAALQLGDWPWPLRVQAEGDGVAVLRGDGQRAGGGSRARIPMRLLNLLVQAGPRGIRTGEAADTLWPDAAGDASAHALETTVYRLRRVLGDPEAVVLSGGRLQLDARRVFVEPWRSSGRGASPRV